MNASLDMVVALLMGLMAIFMFSIHSMVDPRHQRWVTVPLYLRIGLLAAGVIFMIRSVNLITLSGREPWALGRVNWEAATLALALFYLFASTTYWIYTMIRERKPQARAPAKAPLAHR